MNGEKSEREKILADTIADILLIAEMYHGSYLFDEDHKEKQLQLFHYAHQLINNTWMDVGKSVDWILEHERGDTRDVKDYMDIEWSKYDES
jgi:hypothetical protein